MMRSLAALALPALLTACGGGGAGGDSFLVPEVPFTSFSAIQPNTTAVMSDAISANATGTYHTVSSGVVQIDTVNPTAETFSGNTQKLTYDRARELFGMTFSTPTMEASFSRIAGTTFACSPGLCTARNATGNGLVVDGTSTPPGWNYQTFGVWNRLASATVFQAGAISAGAVTPASAVPIVGTATFTGLANAFYTDFGGAPFFASATMSANVNWGTKSIAFSTSGTQVTNLNVGGAAAANAGLNLTGTLTYDSALNRFTGPVTPASVAMTGSATGRFYGPAAQELGGIFRLQGAGGTMVGGFGGKR
jgi:hypothetical protein